MFLWLDRRPSELGSVHENSLETASSEGGQGALSGSSRLTVV